MQETTEEKSKDTFTESAGKHLAGAAILTAAGAGIGAAVGAIRHTGIKGNALICGGIGLASSIGFGKDVYETITKPFQTKPQSFVERLEAERAANKERQR